MKTSLAPLDTAIIGGGITGLYTCRQLYKKHGPHHKMALFEGSHRFGGRIETVEMDGFLAEYGPMRFEQRGQPLLMQLIQELGLETSYFPPYTPATDPESLFDLEENESRKATTAETPHLLNTLDLLRLGILRILQKSGGDLNDPCDPRHEEWWATLDENFYRLVRNELTFEGEPLYATGFWNVLSKVLSHKVLKKIIDYGTFYHVIHQNPNAAEWIIFWLRGLHPRDKLVGIRQGTEALITGLVKTLGSLAPEPIPLYLNHRLLSLKPGAGKRILLEFKTQSGQRLIVLARHVVLALPWSPLRHLMHVFPDSVQQAIDAVIPIPLVKCFFVTKDPWWDANTPPQTRASSVPTRELHYYYRATGKEKRGMVMMYGEEPSMNYWKPFVKTFSHFQAELNQDERLLDCYVQYLSRNPGITDPREQAAQKNAVTCFGIHDWSREPFEAGCHIWKPGVKIEEAIDTLTRFALSGVSFADKNIHICGEAYSDYQGFIEGGLRTARTVVEYIA
ncbi:MAG: FAD-dependent oxidoreductase [Deltaproteobacteria bacterium]|nr:FAD-dependent oxidoreductase [Deltaproteobacteria bacterium]